MKAFAVLVAVLALTSSAFGARMLKQEVVCPVDTLKSLQSVNQISYLLEVLNFFPNGVPADVTVAVPDDAGVSTLLQGLGFNNATVLVDQIPTLPTEIVGRLISAILYHVVPTGAFTIDELAAEGQVPTALEGYFFTVGGTPASYTVTDGSGAVANVGNTAEACGSSFFVVSNVLLPAELTAIPVTTLEQARAILAGGAAAPAPAPAVAA